MESTVIGVDWGSTNLRASLIADGRVIDRVESREGIRNVGDASFEHVLATHVSSWKKKHPDARIVLSGMIGSREGWVEAPYADTPADSENLAANLTAVETETLGPVSIVPGVRHDDGGGAWDVMRGEETQVLGLLAELGTEDAIVCVPGTHSKWIVCRGGKIESFRTWATGEAFELLTSQKNSLLTGPADIREIDPESTAFVRGLNHSGREGGWLHQLFLGRTDMLMGNVEREDLPALLSGLLAGSEIREAASMIPDGGETIHLIAGESVAPIYEKTLDWFGIDCARCETEVHAAGIAAICGLA